MKKPLTSWQKTLRTLGYKVNWKEVHSKKRRRTTQQRFHFENLEPRKMLASVSFDDGQLAVTGTEDNDSIVISVADGQLEVEGHGSIGSVADVDSSVINGLAGNDSINLSGVSGVPADSIEITVYGGEGNDTIFGSAGNDVLFGGDGDRIVGDVNLDGDVDFLDISPFITALSTDTYQFEADVDQNGAVDFLDISPFITLLSGGQVSVGDGDDGNDTIEGGAGDDILQGGTGDDTYVFSGGQNLGVDTVMESLGEGQDGLDFRYFGDSSSGVTIDLSDTGTQSVASGTLSLTALAEQEIENVTGMEFGDNNLTGNELNNVLIGGRFVNTIRGGLGNDTLAGLIGNDNFIFGGDGNDSIWGGAGNDVIHGDDGDDELHGLGGDDQLFGGSGIDQLEGGGGNDLLVGGGGSDNLVGGEGGDVLVGGDRIVGDVNQDGQVDFSDINPYIAVLNAGAYQFEADANQDGLVNFLDTSPLIGLLQAGTPTNPLDGNDTIDGGAGIDSPEAGFTIDDIDGDTVTITATGLLNASEGFIDYGNGTDLQPISPSSSTFSYTYPQGGRYTINLSYQRESDTHLADSMEVAVLSTNPSPVLITSISQKTLSNSPPRFQTVIEWENYTAGSTEEIDFIVERSLNGLDTWVELEPFLGSFENQFIPIPLETDTSSYSFVLGESLHDQQTFYYRVTTVKGGTSSNPSEPSRLRSAANDLLAATATITGPSEAPAVKIEFFEEFLVESTNPDYAVFRKLQSEDSFDSTPIAAFQHSDFPDGWTDNDVEPGKIYDYRINRVGEGLGGKAVLSVVVDAGAERHENRGSVIVVIDNRFEVSLADEISRLKSDLIGDGYFVIEQFEDRVSDPAEESHAALAIRDRIIEHFDEHEGTKREVTSVLLLGDIPSPGAGFADPGGHGDDRVLAADILYGDVDGTYTDMVEFNSNFNSPSDGRYDQNNLVDDGDGSPLELSVGRIDMSRLTLEVDDAGEVVTELELLRRYLDKDHDFRTGIVDVENAAIIDDWGQVNPGIGSPTDSRSSAYAVVGRGNTHIQSYATDLTGSNTNDWAAAIDAEANSGNFSDFAERDSFLFGLGAGSGFVQHVNYVASSGENNGLQGLATGTSQAVFTRFSGSYSYIHEGFNSLLRSVLADEGLGLTSIWSRSSGGFSFHGMGTGGTVGESYLTTVNQGSDLTGGGNDNVYTNLMGDPTLRAHVVDAPSNVMAFREEGSLQVTWTTSSEDTANGGQIDSDYPGDFLGYHVYRASSFDGEFERVTDYDGNDLFTGNTALFDGSESDVWMVRAVKRELTNSGSYINLSQGAFSREYSLI